MKKSTCFFNNRIGEQHLCYYMKNKLWHSVPPMNDRRINYAMVQHQGKIYVLGGTSRGRILSACEYFDPCHQKWIYMRHLQQPRTHSTAVCIPDAHILGKYYIVIMGGIKDYYVVILTENLYTQIPLKYMTWKKICGK